MGLRKRKNKVEEETGRREVEEEEETGRRG